MFGWIQKLLNRRKPQTRAEFLAVIDKANDIEAGGPGTEELVAVGAISLPSGTLLLGDPQWMDQCVVEWGRPVELQISLNLLVRPKGTVRVNELILRATDDSGSPDAWREEGKIGIDSAKIVVVDHEAQTAHWTQTGPDRIGFIRIMKGDHCLKLLKRRFRFRIDQADWHEARIADPVSVEREIEVLDYLKTVPEFATYPFMDFWVRTNNSFDRVNLFENVWGFLPIGNSPEPVMFVTKTGYGDGSYQVNGGCVGSRLVEVRIPFMTDE